MSLMTRIASLPLFTINICAHIDVLFKINKEIPTRTHTDTAVSWSIRRDTRISTLSLLMVIT